MLELLESKGIDFSVHRKDGKWVASSRQSFDSTGIGDTIESALTDMICAQARELKDSAEGYKRSSESVMKTYNDFCKEYGVILV